MDMSDKNSKIQLVELRVRYLENLKIYVSAFVHAAITQHTAVTGL